MFRIPGKVVSPERIESIFDSVNAALDAEQPELAWKRLKPLRRAQAQQEDVAERLLDLVEQRRLPVERGLEMLEGIAEAHADNPMIIGQVGASTEGARDLDQLNLAAPAEPFFADLVRRIERLLDTVDEPKVEIQLLSGLATVARMTARQQDDAAERAYSRLTELSPQRSSTHYNYGLYLKTRGRFREGMQANQRAAALAAEPVEAYDWNLGICATGAGEAQTALAVWKRLGQKIAMGRYGLPEGGYPSCKVMLAERPLAERSAENDDPGLEETIWIERLSPCHGIVRSVLYQDLGVDYGDVVLMDGAPVTYHRYGDREVPVFPHLTTLVRNHYHFFDFAGTQEEAGQIDGLDRQLDGDVAVYSHSENFVTLCSSCFRDPGVDHQQHGADRHHVVTGRIAMPPDIEAGQLLEGLDALLAELGTCRLYAPALAEAAGQTERMQVDRRRYDMLTGN